MSKRSAKSSFNNVTWGASLAWVAAIWLAGCSAAIPPKELKSARETYAAAKKGDAAALAPAQLEEARQALDQAESAFKSDGDEPETRDAAYIALRKIQIAMSVGAVEAAARQKVQAQKDLEALRGQLQEQTESKLQKTAAQLEKAQAEGQKTAAQLEAERKARMDAEGKLSAALASLEKLAQVKEEKRGLVITLSGSVLFTTGKWELLPIAEQKLADVAKALKDQGYKKLLVEGHTDSRGSDQDNQSLSKKRAEAVRTFMVSRGIEADKITAEGIGEARPVADNKTEEGRANNRRVEIVVTPES